MLGPLIMQQFPPLLCVNQSNFIQTLCRCVNTQVSWMHAPNCPSQSKINPRPQPHLALPLALVNPAPQVSVQTQAVVADLSAVLLVVAGPVARQVARQAAAEGQEAVAAVVARQAARGASARPTLSKVCTSSCRLIDFALCSNQTLA